MQKPSPVHRLLTLAALLAALPAAAAPDNITDLGTMRNDNLSFSNAFAISADGSVIVGQASADNLHSQTTVWSGNNWATKTNLGSLKADNLSNSRAYGVSGDGSVVVGYSSHGRGLNEQRRAAVWFGDGWSSKIDLSTRTPGAIGNSEAMAVSRDGSKIVGYMRRPGHDYHATVWSGNNWTTVTDLGTLATDNSKLSYARGISSDGSVVVGEYIDDNGTFRAITWSGSNWADKKDLGTLRHDNSGQSLGRAVSGDGSVVFGQATNDYGEVHAVVWHGENWTDKKDLGTLRDDNSGHSLVRAANGDGSVIGGWADDDKGYYRAAIWYGKNWANKKDLGTLTADNSGRSEVNGLSADGSIAVGSAENDNGDIRAAVWNLRSFNIRAADTANTRTSLSLLSADTASLLAQRARAAENLLGGCRADGGKFCYSAGYRRDIGHGASSRGADFAFGYGISDNFDAAVSLAVPARAEENGSHRLKSGVGIGLSARLHNGAGWYAVPAAAFETDKTRIRRPHLNGTESPENTVRTKGRAYSLTAGRDYGTPGEKTLGWYAALRRTEAERPSYSEDAGLSFPFAYGAAKLKETSLAAGIKGRLPLTGKLAWYGNAEVAQRVGGGKARFTAEAPFFGKYETERETSRTRPSVQTGVDYAFSPSAVLSLGGYVGRNAFSGTDKGMFLKLNGKF